MKLQPYKVKSTNWGRVMKAGTHSGTVNAVVKAASATVNDFEEVGHLTA